MLQPPVHRQHGGPWIPEGVRFDVFRHALVTDLKQQGFQNRDIALITGDATA
ncbi:hypothetical protein LA76x_1398 [Lysobacter antibioticus]|uniref:Uncharacterized protein n=1 Tax=Lysobacter antibioticus TaxID=84531 RepID=A0A0S2F7P5_LYSAN|nr:hypothetical protein LA76x_1398 [Lysobacter antibioticus]